MNFKKLTRKELNIDEKVQTYEVGIYSVSMFFIMYDQSAKGDTYIVEVRSPTRQTHVIEVIHLTIARLEFQKQCVLLNKSVKKLENERVMKV